MTTSKQKPKGKNAGHSARASQKPAIRYGNYEFPIGSYLGAVGCDLILRSLRMRQRLALALNGYAYLAAAQPPAFSSSTDIYLVKGRQGFYLSYRQGYAQEFYEPDGGAP